LGKANTRDNNLNPSGMSENSSKSMKPPLSDELKESKENLSKGCKKPMLTIHLEIPESQKVRFILTTRL